MSNFTPKSMEALQQERRLKALISSARVTETDRSKFEELCSKFRTTCIQINSILKWPMFLGSYDECEQAVCLPVMASIEAQTLYNKLNILNSACKHEGEKLGYRSAEWWKYCWKDALSSLAQQQKG